jgi:hypothetical protein
MTAKEQDITMKEDKKIGKIGELKFFIGTD